MADQSRTCLPCRDAIIARYGPYSRAVCWLYYGRFYEDFVVLLGLVHGPQPADCDGAAKLLPSHVKS